jgi:hypothetical protein
VLSEKVDAHSLGLQEDRFHIERALTTRHLGG